MNVHKNKQEAQAALDEYVSVIEEASCRLWCWGDSGDPCLPVYFGAEYYDEEGKVRTLTSD